MGMGPACSLPLYLLTMAQLTWKQVNTGLYRTWEMGMQGPPREAKALPLMLLGPTLGSLKYPGPLPNHWVTLARC